MTIGIDLRLLSTSFKTGVGMCASLIVDHLLAIDRENTYILFANDSRGREPKEFDAWRQYTNVQCVTTRVPNKALNASLALCGLPHIDSFIARRSRRLDVFFSPNLNFTSLHPTTRWVLMIHDLSFAFFRDCFSQKQRWWHRAVAPQQLVRRAHTIVVPSQHTQWDVMDYFGVPEESVQILSPGPTTSNIVPKHASKKYILYVGSIEYRKNVSGLVEAFLWWKQSHPALSAGYSLVLVGPKGYGAGEVFSRIAGHSDIEYRGYVSEQEKDKLYREASLFVYPSFYEGFGFPVLDAMYQGVPVVTSNRSSLPEITADAAYLVNPYNIIEIAQGIHHVVSDSALHEWYKTKGMERAKEFSWERTAKQFLSLFQTSV